MIVFPEYGLMPSGLTRQRAYNFTEPIIDPRSIAFNPCRDGVIGLEVQRRLSCIAINNSMYITANIGERAPCDQEQDTQCPFDGRHQFNTNIVFSPDGFVLARYRKYNLFMGEPSYNQPSTVDYTFFDTPYGRFGAIVCFDIIFQQPAAFLVENFNVSHVLFPTAWMNQLPYYSAVTFHQAFAIGLGVNLLAANRHLPSRNMVGSGIYGSNETYSFHYDDITMNSRLLISEIPTVPSRTQGRHPTHRQHSMVDQSEMEGPLFEDIFRFVKLKGLSGTVSTCHNTLCCMLNYTRDMSEDVFALGSFRGLHTHEGQYYLEMCVLVKCRVSERSQCEGDSTTSQTRFTFFSMTGNFSTKYVYPMVVSDGIDPSSGDWEYTGENIVSHGTKKALISSTMYGRRFDLDQPANSAPSVHKLPWRLCYSLPALAMTVFFVRLF